MIRLLGFCLGSIASITALVFLVGMPEFHLASDDENLARFDAAVDKLKAKRVSQPEPSTPEPVGDPVAVTEAAARPVETPTVAEEDDPASTALADIESGNDPMTDAIPPPAAAQPEWHVLWTPFRSEIAARGFVSRLESVTGLDYRVIKLGNGVYEVAVPYRDDSELSAKLLQISSATGLDLSSGLP